MVDTTLTGFRFGQQIEVYYLIVAWMLVCVALMYLQTKTPLGRVANAVRDNPERAAFIGYNARWVRTLQLTLAAFSPVLPEVCLPSTMRSSTPRPSAPSLRAMY